LPLAIRTGERPEPELIPFQIKSGLCCTNLFIPADKGVCKPPLNAGLIAIQFLCSGGAAPAAAHAEGIHVLL